MLSMPSYAYLRAIDALTLRCLRLLCRCGCAKDGAARGGRGCDGERGAIRALRNDIIEYAFYTAPDTVLSMPLRAADDDAAMPLLR